MRLLSLCNQEVALFIIITARAKSKHRRQLIDDWDNPPPPQPASPRPSIHPERTRARHAQTKKNQPRWVLKVPKAPSPSRGFPPTTDHTSGLCTASPPRDWAPPCGSSYVVFLCIVNWQWLTCLVFGLQLMYRAKKDGSSPRTYTVRIHENANDPLTYLNRYRSRLARLEAPLGPLDSPDEKLWHRGQYLIQGVWGNWLDWAIINDMEDTR